MTNQLRGSQYATSIITREGCWLQSSSVHPDNEDQEDAWSQTLRCTYIATSSRERDELGQELRLRSQFA